MFRDLLDDLGALALGIVVLLGVVMFFWLVGTLVVSLWVFNPWYFLYGFGALFVSLRVYRWTHKKTR